MNEREELHQHRLYILFPLVSTIRGLIPAIIIFGFNLFNGSLERTTWYWIITGIITAIVLLIGYGWLQWRRFVYVLEDHKIVIHRGVFFREEVSIYTGRIHSMNMEQPLVQRILGLTQVKIDTPGKSDDGGKLPAVSSAEAERLQRWLRERTAAGSTLSDLTEPRNVGSMDTAKQHSETEEYVCSDRTNLRSHNEQFEHLTDVEKTKDAIPTHKKYLPNEANDKLLAATTLETTNVPEERTVLLQLSAGRLMLAALTSLNISLALAFAAGLFSLADDILPDKLYSRLFQEAGHILAGGWITVIALALILAWLLSAVLYTIKYAGFTVERVGKQIAVTCGLLERKQMFFSPQRVQAVTVKEGLLRQPFGFSEVKLHVLTSESEKNLMLHPMIPMKEVGALLKRIVPQYNADTVDTPPPPRSLWLYMRLEAFLSIAVSAACIWYFKMPGLWSLLLVPVSLLWAILTHKDAGIHLQGKQLTIRNRRVSRTTKYIRRPQVISLKVSGTSMQRRKNLLSFEVNLISSQYDGKMFCLEQSAVERIWNWYRRSKGTSSNTISTAKNSQEIPK